MPRVKLTRDPALSIPLRPKCGVLSVSLQGMPPSDEDEEAAMCPRGDFLALDAPSAETTPYTLHRNPTGRVFYRMRGIIIIPICKYLQNYKIY